MIKKKAFGAYKTDELQELFEHVGSRAGRGRRRQSDSPAPRDPAPAVQASGQVTCFAWGFRVRFFQGML